MAECVPKMMAQRWPSPRYRPGLSTRMQGHRRAGGTEAGPEPGKRAGPGSPSKEQRCVLWAPARGICLSPCQSSSRPSRLSPSSLSRQAPPSFPSSRFSDSFFHIHPCCTFKKCFIGNPNSNNLVVGIVRNLGCERLRSLPEASNRES